MSPQFTSSQISSQSPFLLLHSIYSSPVSKLGVLNLCPPACGGYQGKMEDFHRCRCNSNLQRSTMEQSRLQEGRRGFKATSFHHQQS
ncbi:unnamed protein product [Linum trigynum]|uniref:Uncharacterized protein n=1 Tax=Linum trigynum TaxID=586398 RepID=A0AAV2CXS0_9ROSI